MRKPAPAEIQAERAQATKDYETELQAVRERTAKLRAERLARVAAGGEPSAPKKPAKAKK